MATVLILEMLLPVIDFRHNFVVADEAVRGAAADEELRMACPKCRAPLQPKQQPGRNRL